MIVEYHRPNSLSDALILLSRKKPATYALGGGTVLNRGNDESIAVVDLQDLGFGKITRKGNQIRFGATVTLQQLLDTPGLPTDFYQAIQHEATYNLRQIATIAGKVVSAGARSPFLTALLALDTRIEIFELDQQPKHEKIGDWLPLRDEKRYGKLITSVSVAANVHLAYEYVARTPADSPIVCAVVVRWDSGRTRLALGGWGKVPMLALDGPTADGIEFAAMSAYSHAQDEWAGAEYRQEMAGVLSLRCLKHIHAE
jgi:CO/xanthine dehydrogenase FAD-binding subunit